MGKTGTARAHPYERRRRPKLTREVQGEKTKASERTGWKRNRIDEKHQKMEVKKPQASGLRRSLDYTKNGRKDKWGAKNSQRKRQKGLRAGKRRDHGGDFHRSSRGRMSVRLLGIKNGATE